MEKETKYLRVLLLAISTVLIKVPIGPFTIPFKLNGDIEFTEGSFEDFKPNKEDPILNILVSFNSNS